ncbi:MAC/perforin domain-containing protein [Nocardia asteroides]
MAQPKISVQSKPATMTGRQAVYVGNLEQFMIFSLLKAIRDNVPPPRPLIPGVEFIGCGYNVFGEYANPSAVVGDIFDFTKTKSFTEYAYKPGATPWSVPNPVVVKPVGETSYKTRSGETILDYSREWKTDTGLDGDFLFFKGEVEATVSRRERFKAENTFTSVQFNQPLYSMRLDVTLPEARDLLLPDFAKRLDSVESEGETDALFDTFGTHVVTGIVMGGAIDQISVTDKQKIDASVTVGKAAKAALDFIIKIGADTSHSATNDVKEFLKNSTYVHRGVGGDPNLRGILVGNRGKFEEWVASIPRNPAPIDFLPGTAWRSLVPVWKLAKTGARQAKLKKAYERYALRKSAQTDFVGPVVGRLTVITGRSPGIEPAAPFEKINVDLNRRAGGDFIYLCTQRMTRAELRRLGERPITSLAVVIGRNTPAPAGYTRIEVDLNKGADGKFVYLCYKLGEPEKAIRDIMVIHGTNAAIAAPIGYTKVPQDLNMGSGGDFIFVCYANV